MRVVDFKFMLIIAIVTMVITVKGYSQSVKGPSTNHKRDTLIVKDSCRLVQYIYYTCPAHPKVRSEKAGNCPQCGMTLDKRKEAIYYSCPMHSEVQHNQKGNCEKCGTALIEEHEPLLK